MSDNWLEYLAEAELLSDHKGKCDGECERDNVVITEWYCRGQYADRPVIPKYNFCYWCAVQFNERWDDLWAEYYSSRF